MNEEIKRYIIEIANKTLETLDKYGYIPGGKNGPYNDEETPIRNSAHWIYIYSWLYRKDKDIKYYEAVKKLAEYLTSQNIEKSYYSFNCRNKEGKDHVNGTIGQAWAIEGLVEAFRILKEDKYYDLAEKVFLSHDFDERIGCWNRCEIDGKILGFDGTFNHQLWFAAAGSEILEYKENSKIRNQINTFLDKCLNKNTIFHVHKNGVVCHYSCINDNIKSVIYYYLREFKNLFKKKFKLPNMEYKEEGYHYFALYGFALLKKQFGEHAIFKSKKLELAIDYAISEKNYLRQMKTSSSFDGTKLATKYKGSVNIYCFPYNSPFYEIPFINKELNNSKNQEKYIDELWKIHKSNFLSTDNLKENNVNDEITLKSRIYELLRAFD